MLNSLEKASVGGRNESPTDFTVFDQTDEVCASTRTSETTQALSCRFGVLHSFSQLIVPRATLPNSRPDTSDGPLARATNDAVVEKQLVLTWTQAVARFRGWFRCPPLCQRAGLELAQPLAAVPREPFRSSISWDQTPRSVSHCRLRLASGGGARIRGTRTAFIDLRGAPCVARLFTTSGRRILHRNFALHPDQKGCTCRNCLLLSFHCLRGMSPVPSAPELPCIRKRKLRDDPSCLSHGWVGSCPHTRKPTF